MSPPTHAENIPDHTNDDLVMEGESSEDEGGHAPKNTASDPRDVYLHEVAMLLLLLNATVCSM
jgi:hypothetical protein